MNSFETIKVALETNKALITVHRPNVLNALNRTAIAELGEAFRSLGTDPGVLGIVLTGAGEKAFVAGADIEEISKLDAQAGKEFARCGQAVFNLIETLGKPVVAAVNGFALGGGCELALACTVRVASETARFGQPEVKLGLIPGFGGTQRLTRLIGPGRALELLLTGRTITAQEALGMGLVSKVVPAAELLDEARRLLDDILKNSPFACRLCLEAVRRGQNLDLDSALAVEADLFGLAAGSADMKEGTGAFLQKRKPVFTGR